jgi:hypothetical protein
VGEASRTLVRSRRAGTLLGGIPGLEGQMSETLAPVSLALAGWLAALSRSWDTIPQGIAMQRLANVLIAVSAAVSLTAQAAIQASSAGILVQVGASAPATSPVGQNLGPGIVRSATTTSGSGLFRAEHLTSTAAIDLQWTLSADAMWSTTAVSEGEVRYELSASEPVLGQLVVTWAPSASGTGATSCWFDLFDDGLDTTTSSATYDLWLGPSPLPFRVHAGVTASAGTVNGPWNTHWSYSGAASGTLSMRFVPTHCTAVAFANGCADPDLQIVGNLLGGADLRGTCNAAADLGIAVLGLDQHVAPLPLSPGCTLATTPLLALWQPLDAQQQMTCSIALPAAVRPASFAAQLVGFDFATNQATTSRAFWVTCQ